MKINAKLTPLISVSQDANGMVRFMPEANDAWYRMAA